MIKLLLPILLVLTTLWGDMTLTFKSDGKESLKFYYHDQQHMRLSILDGDEHADIYLIGKKSYLVARDGNCLYYFDIDELRAMMMMFGAVNHESFNPFVGVISKGGSTTVAGIKGYKWKVRFRDSDGEVVKENIVVTNHKDIVHALKMLGKTIDLIPNPDEQRMSIFEVEPGYVMIGSPEMTLSHFSKKSLSSDLFKLPVNAYKQSMSNGMMGPPKECRGEAPKVHHKKAKPTPPPAPERKKVKRCAKWASEGGDDNYGASMKYSKKRCVKWYYEYEDGTPVSSSHSNSHSKSGSSSHYNAHESEDLGDDDAADAAAQMFKSFF